MNAREKEFVIKSKMNIKKSFTNNMKKCKSSEERRGKGQDKEMRKTNREQGKARQRRRTKNIENKLIVKRNKTDNKAQREGDKGRDKNN